MASFVIMGRQGSEDAFDNLVLQHKLLPRLWVPCPFRSFFTFRLTRSEEWRYSKLLKLLNQAKGFT